MDEEDLQNMAQELLNIEAENEIKEIKEQVKKVGEISKDFGEAEIVLPNETKRISLFIYDNKDLFYKKQLEKYFYEIFGEQYVDVSYCKVGSNSELNFHVVIHIPSLTITNSDNETHEITDLYVKLINEDSSVQMRGLRGSAYIQEIQCGYRHSHLETCYQEGGNNFSRFCYGDSDLSKTLRSMSEHVSDCSKQNKKLEDIVILGTAMAIDSYIKWESLSGGPYMTISDIPYEYERASSFNHSNNNSIFDKIKYKQAIRKSTLTRSEFREDLTKKIIQDIDIKSLDFAVLNRGKFPKVQLNIAKTANTINEVLRDIIRDVYSYDNNTMIIDDDELIHLIEYELHPGSLSRIEYNSDPIDKSMDGESLLVFKGRTRYFNIYGCDNEEDDIILKIEKIHFPIRIQMGIIILLERCIERKIFQLMQQ